MPEIRPFRALRYDTRKVSPENIVAPPYDVISPEQQELLYGRSEYNVVRLILGREEDRYTEARENLIRWKKEGILRMDDKEGIYFLSQSFTGPDGISHDRKGFIALCRVEEFKNGSVLPHEKTLSKPKEDRFKLIQATKTNLSQIFSIYADRENRIGPMLDRGMEGMPVVETEFEDVRNSLWRSTDPGLLRDIVSVMKEKTVLIADGHHRYETALAYRDLMRIRTGSGAGREPFHYTMMFFASMDDRGLVVFPTHRLVYGLPEFDQDGFLRKLRVHFDVSASPSCSALAEALISRSEYSYGMIVPGGYFLVSLKQKASPAAVVGQNVPPEVRDLDVTLLHSGILEGLLGISRELQERKEHLEYVKNTVDADAAVQSGRCQIGFLMNATKLEQIRRVSRAGHTMPQKSTFFYPKLLSGLLLYPLEDEGGSNV